MEVNKGTSFLRANVGGARDSEKTFRAGYLNEVKPCLGPSRGLDVVSINNG